MTNYYIHINTFHARMQEVHYPYFPNIFLPSPDDSLFIPTGKRFPMKNIFPRAENAQ